MEQKIILKQDFIDAFSSLGIKKGMNIIVHTSLKSFGFVCGGAQTVIESLIESVGDNGTIMMPSQSWKNLDPETGVHWEVAPENWDIIRENWPAYDKDITPTNTMGAVAEMFRKWPGAVRSDHPARSFAALGKNAEHLVSDHDLCNIFGKGSPLSKLYDLDGYILLLGVGYDKNTSLHLADALAEYPGKHLSTEHSAIIENGKRVWKAYDTLYVDGEDFIDIGKTFESEYPLKKAKIGNADVTFIRQRELVDFAIKWIEENRK